MPATATRARKNSASKQEKLAAEKKALEELLLSSMDDAMEDWSAYLKCLSKVTKYSWNNNCLLWMQQKQRDREFTGMVRTFIGWQKDFNRTVKKGSKSYAIYQPLMVPVTDDNGNVIVNIKGKPVKKPIGFGIARVFDYRDTEGEPLADKPDTSHVMEELDDIGNPKLYEALKQVAKNRNVEVNEATKSILGSAHGWCEFYNDDGTASEIKVLKDLNNTTKATVLMHELGHAIMHDRNAYEDHKPTSIKELEAESVSFLVANHYGISTENKAFDYIIGHNKSDPKLRETMKESGNTIFKAYKEIIEVTDKCLAKEEVK
tara:strand:+ start:467 stop:1420 length:954 start_codon:yes stop_codon:yes gene_type:complete